MTADISRDKNQPGATGQLDTPLITLREIITRFVQSPELINYQFIINFDQIRYLCNEYLCLTELSFFYMLIISFSSLSSCEKGTNRVLLSEGSKL